MVGGLIVHFTFREQLCENLMYIPSLIVRQKIETFIRFSQYSFLSFPFRNGNLSHFLQNIMKHLKIRPYILFLMYIKNSDRPNALIRTRYNKIAMRKNMQRIPHIFFSFLQVNARFPLFPVFRLSLLHILTYSGIQYT